MEDYVIATASTADLPIEYLKEHNIPFIGYSFTIDSEVYTDDCSQETKDFLLHKMREGKLPNTSQISEYAYYVFFEEILKTGKDILFTDMSRDISASIANAERAIARLAHQYPERKIRFVDSYCISGGLNIFVKQLVKRKEEGMGFDELAEWGEAHKREFIHRFLVDDLQWLRRGGRLSNASAIVGSLLSIKPLIYVNNKGQLVAYNKVRGRKKSIHELILSCRDDLADYSADEEILIFEADVRSDAEALREALRETYPQLKDAEINISTVGPVIASHVGPGFLAILYHGKPRIM